MKIRDPRKQVLKKREKILKLARSFGAEQVFLFGSCVRGEEAQDIDFLVALAPDRTLLDLAGLSESLRELLGCRVDVFTQELLKPAVREEALKRAQPL